MVPMKKLKTIKPPNVTTTENVRSIEVTATTSMAAGVNWVSDQWTAVMYMYCQGQSCPSVASRNSLWAVTQVAPFIICAPMAYQVQPVK